MIRRRITPGVVACLLVGVALQARPCAAQPSSSMDRSPHTASSELLAGAKGIGLFERVDRQSADDETRFGGGGGAYVEVSLVPGWLEVELGLMATRTGDETVVTFEPFLKKNLHLDAHVDMYLGVGPVLGVVTMPEGARGLYGGSLVVGSYVWFADWIGIDVDLTATLAFVVDPMVEVSFGLGPVLRLG